jgi:hypothetical protein
VFEGADPISNRVGVVARDHEGSMLPTTWKFLRRCGSPEEAEVEACLEGIRLAAEWIHQLIWVESDCLHLVKAIESGKERSNVGGVSLRDKIG